MPFKSKKRRTESSPKPAGDSDLQQSPVKRAKIDKDTSSSNPAGQKVDSNGDVYWELSRLRRVTVSTFKGKTMVSIREYYEKDKQELPGKKGISMTIDQFNSFIRLLPDIETTLSEKGETVPRPTYAGQDGELDRSNEAEKDVESPRAAKTKDSAAVSKRNIEATSDEEEEEA